MVFLGFSEIPSLLSFVTDHALGASELCDSLSWLQVWLPGKWHLEMDLREVSGGVPSGTTPVGEGGWGRWAEGDAGCPAVTAVASASAPGGTVAGKAF